MKLRTCSLAAYTLPLVKPITHRNMVMSARRGLVLSLADLDGNTGYGECAPLPGLHTETIEECVADFREIMPALAQGDVPDCAGGKDEISAVLATGILNSPLPTVHYACEMALLHLWAQRHSVAVSNLINTHAAHTVNVNMLFTCDMAFDLAERLMPGSFIKIKVGRSAPEEEIGFVQHMAAHLTANSYCILDANRSWRLEEAIAFCASLPKTGQILYIEEPVIAAHELPAFHAATGMRYALDESLQKAAPAAPPEGLAAVVYKPDLHGGIQPLLHYAQWCRDHQISLIPSNSYYSGLGTNFLAHCTAAFPEIIPYSGLDTYHWFAQDVLTRPLAISQNCYTIPTSGEVHIDTTKLSEITRIE
ncbi:MAG: o-succinylbenzoate synthase [Chitinivibrionales bacterium]|nr:o-succinylbenzoate synthase [Chitinivibrionales bacterium]